MLNLFAVFLGGGLGSLLRFGAALLSRKLFSSALFGTLAVNLVGSFLIGFLSGYFINRAIDASSPIRQLLISGFLGGLTTFSTLNLEAFELIKLGKVLPAALYLCISIILGLLATSLGYYLSLSTSSS